MTVQTSTALVPVAGSMASETSEVSCGTGQKSGRMKWLMILAAALLVIGLITGSAGFGFAAIAPLLYALPCLIMCGMCLFKHGGTAKG